MHPRWVGPVLFDPASLSGALFLGVVVFVLASVIAVLIRRGARHFEPHLSDLTLLKFVCVFAQLLAYLIGLVVYANLVPQLRTLGTTLLAGASIISVVIGLAAQDSLGNLIAGFSLVLSRTVRVGDSIRLYCPVGVITAKVQLISLGFTLLVDGNQNEIVVPNSVMMSSAIARITHEVSDGAQNR
jgi:small-conductance mechanosensitive channel